MNVNLKKWMAKVTARLANIPTDGTGWITITNQSIMKYSDFEKVTLTRRGDVCTLKFNGVKLYAPSSAARTDFLLIQYDFAPFTEIGMPFDSSNLWFFVRPDGTVAVNPMSADTTVWGACTYLVKK